MGDPLLLETYRRQAEERLLPAILAADIRPELKLLLQAYLSVGPFRGEATVRDHDQLMTIPCLDDPRRHQRLCERAIFEICR
jgi:hypothetical protein